jgi:hypothetical protein
LGSGYFPITQTFGSFAICLDEADIAWVHGKARATSVSASRIVGKTSRARPQDVALLTSAYGTFRTWRNVRLESAMRGKADITIEGRQVRL